MHNLQHPIVLVTPKISSEYEDSNVIYIPDQDKSSSGHTDNMYTSEYIADWVEWWWQKREESWPQ